MSGARVSSPTFVGRAAELELLDGALERAAEGVPAFAFVAGESGVGKTRLLGELVVRACARDLLGQCLGAWRRVEAAAVAHRLGLAGAPQT